LSSRGIRPAKTDVQRTARPTLPSHLPRTYWQGGSAGLSVGEYVLPPSITGAPHAGESGLTGPADRVSVTLRYEVAEVLAALSDGEGCIYRVLPEGPLEVDPDSPEDSWTCARARVVSVHPLDAATEARLLKALLREGRS
jgi:hypothetical protein